MGQAQVADHGNKITVLELSESLDVAGAVLTTAAVGTQKQVAWAANLTRTTCWRLKPIIPSLMLMSYGYLKRLSLTGKAFRRMTMTQVTTPTVVKNSVGSGDLRMYLYLMKSRPGEM